jgi:membrane-bound ClpP family serine protease
VAGTDLRPVGAGLFGEERVDVVCEEGFLPKGTPIEVIKDEGYRKVVRRKEEE